MRLRVNGEDRDFPPELDISGLLVLLDAPPEGVAVAVNEEVVPRTMRDRPLCEGDRVEVIRAVGGG